MEKIPILLSKTRCSINKRRCQHLLIWVSNWEVLHRNSLKYKIQIAELLEIKFKKKLKNRTYVSLYFQGVEMEKIPILFVENKVFN